jgi:hypothetical protein
MFSYIFNSLPGPTFSYYYELVILAGLLILGSFFLKNYYKKRVQERDFAFKKLYKKAPNRMIYLAIGLLFLVLVRYENIPYFSMRFLLYLYMLALVAYLGYQAYKYFKTYPIQRDKLESKPKVENVKMKYLPNKRRR